MKKHFSITLFVLIFAMRISGQIPTTGLLGYYPFNNNANDASGNAYHATVYGAGLTTDRFGNTNCAYSFNGTSDYISLPAGPFTTLNNYSYSFWFKAASNTAGFIYCAGDGTFGPNQSIGFQTNTLLFAGSYNIGGNPTQSYCNSGSISTNTWTHVVVTRDNSSIKLYINGVFITATGSSNTNGQAANYGGANYLYLGARTNLSSFYNGAIDDLRIYSTTLNSSEITSLYTEPGCYSAVPFNSGTSISICSGSLATISTPSVGNAIINWFSSATATTAVGGGTIFTTPVFNAPGVYTYYAEANGCTLYPRTAINIIVNSIPTLGINSGNICAGQSFTFTPIGAVTYTYPGGSPIVSPASTSTFVVKGASGSGCSASIISTITVYQLPTISASGPNGICLGTNAIITASGALTYTWNGTQIGAAVSISPTVLTTYTVIGTDIQGCKNSTQKTIAVYALPTLTATGNSTICEGANTTLFVNGSALTYSWSNGVLGNLATVNPSSSVIYTVSGTDMNGCVGLITQLVQVNSSPPVLLVASNAAICAGAAVTLSGSGAASYVWPAGINNTIAFYPSATSVYSVTGIASNGCMRTVTAQVVVNALPTLSLSSSTQVICVGESVTLTAAGANIYSWSTGNITTNIVLTPTLTSNYTVMGTDGNGCSASGSITQKVEECTGISKTLVQKNISMYPNPAREFVTIFLSEISSGQRVEIVNSLGSILHVQTLDSNETLLSLSAYAKGFYLVRIYDSAGFIMEKKLIVAD